MTIPVDAHAMSLEIEKLKKELKDLEDIAVDAAYCAVVSVSGDTLEKIRKMEDATTIAFYMTQFERFSKATAVTAVQEQMRKRGLL